MNSISAGTWLFSLCILFFLVVTIVMLRSDQKIDGLMSLLGGVVVSFFVGMLITMIITSDMNDVSDFTLSKCKVQHYNSYQLIDGGDEVKIGGKIYKNRNAYSNGNAYSNVAKINQNSRKNKYRAVVKTYTMTNDEKERSLSSFNPIRHAVAQQNPKKIVVTLYQ